MSQWATRYLAKHPEPADDRENIRKGLGLDNPAPMDKPQEWDGKCSHPTFGKLHISDDGAIVLAIDGEPIEPDCFCGIYVAWTSTGNITQSWLIEKFRPATAADLIRAGLIEG